MEPVISNNELSSSRYKFRLSGVNHTIANALRRTMVSDIPTVIFRTTPYTENKASFLKNTTRFHNEILKQRLSCIPIHFMSSTMSEFYSIDIGYVDNLLRTKKILEKYLLELDETNTSDITMNVTTEHFKIFDKEANNYIPQPEVKLIFPPFIPYNRDTEYYILYVKLRPKITDDIPGESIQMSSEFSYGSAKEDGSFSVVQTCAYGNTVDEEAAELKLQEKRSEWSSTMTVDEIDRESENWKLLERKRIFLPNSFDFTVESIGIYDNQVIVTKACEIIIERLYLLNYSIDSDKLEIKTSPNITENSYDIILFNDDYTIGSMLQYVMYITYYPDVMNYCGYKKMHPDDSYSIIRVSYNEPVGNETIKEQCKTSIVLLIDVFQKIRHSIIPDEPLFQVRPTVDWDAVLEKFYKY